MILQSKLDSVIESLYLGMPLINRFKDATIVVNPDNINYLVGKTVIITTSIYPEKNIEVLLRNNTVISRIPQKDSRVKFVPYLPRLCSKIMWNGEYVRFLNEDIYEGAEYIYDGDTLYYPKCLSFLLPEVQTDTPGCLGYLLYQLGENIFKETPFTDLDIVKIGKAIFP